MQAGYKARKGNRWWRIRGAIENHADYSDGNSSRVLNSRFDGYYLKSTFGFERNHWTSSNNFSSSFNRFGFIFNDVYTFITADKRWSRRLNENPAHLVILNIFSSENKISISERSKLEVNFGVQSNERMENEGGGAISLNMHLLTLQNLIKFHYRLNDRNKLIFSNLNVLEDNTNFGARKIVPDAILQESNLSVYLESNPVEGLVIENGLGVGEKFIHTYFTMNVNGPGKEVQPFKKWSDYYNLYSGVTWFPDKHFNVKANFATGVRVANLAELSSNGLHEGIFTYEIGDPHLKNEQIFSLNFYLNFLSRYLDLAFSPFYNFFNGYIYLTPTPEQWFGFPVYRYKQQNATQYGTECSLKFKPLKHLNLALDYSAMMSKTADGNFTPYIPAKKLVTALSGDLGRDKNFSVRFFTNLEYNFAQGNSAPYEIKTPAYGIWNAGISTEILLEDKTWNFGLAFNNILNKAYYDHLSRFKNYGLLNIGRNFSLYCRIKLAHTSS